MADKKTKALSIIEILRKNGFNAYLVGGAVRDMVMGIDPVDYDIATNASTEDVERLFSPVVPVGRQFGVNIVVIEGDSFEIAQFRSDSAYSDGRRPDHVRPASLEEDARRRDFTINAMYFDPEDDTIIDTVGGRDAIAGKLVVTVGDPRERLTEDRLRMLRAVRFATRFDYTIEPLTFDAIAENAGLVASVSAERIGAELLKMFTGPHPDRALVLLDETGLLSVVLPEIAAMKGVSQPPQFHPEGDVFEHTRRMLELFGGGGEALAFGILLHDAGKPSTYTETDRIRFNGHDEIGASIAAKTLERLRFGKALTDRVRYLVGNHMRFMDVREMKRSTLARFMAHEGFEDLLELHRLDCLASHGSLETYSFVRKELSRKEPSLPKPLIGGKDLIAAGYHPGPHFSIILDDVYDAQLEGKTTTKEEAITLAKLLFCRYSRRREDRTRRSNRSD